MCTLPILFHSSLLNFLIFSNICCVLLPRPMASMHSFFFTHISSHFHLVISFHHSLKKKKSCATGVACNSWQCYRDICNISTSLTFIFTRNFICFSYFYRWNDWPLVPSFLFWLMFMCVWTYINALISEWILIFHIKQRIFRRKQKSIQKNSVLSKKFQSKI